MKKSYLSAIAILAIAFSCLPTLSQAQVIIELTEVSKEALPVALNDLRSEGDPKFARELNEHLKQMLKFSGHFRVIDKAAYLKPVEKEGFLVTEIDFKHYQLLSAVVLVKGWLRVSGKTVTGKLLAFDVAARKPILEFKVKQDVEKLRRVAMDFVDRLLVQLTGEAGVFDTKIAFISNRTGKKELYVMNIDGSDVQPITSFKNIVLSPSWSEDGRNILFLGYPKRGKQGFPSLYVADLRDERIRRLKGLTGNLVAPRWLPGTNDVLLTMSDRNDPEIYKFNFDKKSRERLTFAYGIDVSPSLSPDGEQMAFVSERGGAGKPQIYVKALKSRAGATRVSFEGNYNTAPSWNPKRNLIAYSGQTKDGRLNIFVVRPDATGSGQLTARNGSNEHPSWSPDGRMIIFSSNRTGKYQLYIMNADGSNVRQVTKGNYDNKMPAWSPRPKYKR